MRFCFIFNSYGDLTTIFIVPIHVECDQAFFTNSGVHLSCKVLMLAYKDIHCFETS